ncbi:CBS domain-containing protein [Nitrosopumilus sp.]|uniref:CBS domain-containing protein n=1 Tax=Nitrosopumilus sp. TaxID=2024843 RepID=UPI002639EA1E|nr:CBS domain-containing protein [Nitrosopumilus sp.]
MSEAKSITIADVMSRSVISIDSSATINEAAKMMEDTKVGSLVIMENNEPMGIVTDRDFAVKVAAHAYPISSPIKQIMSSPVFAVDPKDSVRVAADVMHERKVRKLPVLEGKEVVGMITSTDLVNMLSVCVEEDMRDMYFHSIAKIYKEYSPYN